MRIPTEQIAERLLYIAGQEDFSLTPEAARLIGRLADGGLREKLRQRLSRGAADPHELAAEFPGEAQQIGRALRELLDEGIAGTGRDGKIGLK